MHCPYEENRSQATPETPGISRCRILMIACGFVCSNGNQICDICIKNREWNKGDVPQLEPDAKERNPSPSDAMKIIHASSFFASLYKQILRSRLIAGDCPLYQIPNPVNLNEAFTKFKDKHGRAEAEELLIEMLDEQIEKAKSGKDGHHDETTVRDKIATLAGTHQFITPSEAQELRGVS